MNNFSGSNYYTNQPPYRQYNSYSRMPRGWIIFAQVFGAFFSVIGLIVYLVYMQKIYNGLPSDDLTKKAITALILSIIVYFAWRSIYTAYIIVRLVRNSTDEELSANRYIISALSLSVGGFLTPFLVTQFPNIATNSSIKPRYFLSKTMGLCLLVGAPMLAMSYFLPLLTGINAVSSVNSIFSTSSNMGIVSIVLSVVAAVSFAFGLVTTILYSKTNINNDFNNNNTSKLVKIVSTIWMAILTLELVIVILFAIFRLIGALLDLFRAQEEGGVFRLIFAFFNLMLTIWYVGMVIYVTSRTIAGLWAINGVVTIKKYEQGKWAKNKLFEPEVNVTRN